MRFWNRPTSPFRAIIIYLLCLNLAGCATQRPAASIDPDTLQTPAEQLAIIEDGSLVRVTLVSGQHLSGEIEDIGETTFILIDDDTIGTDGHQKRVVAIEQVEAIETLSASEWETTTAIIVGVVMAALIGFGIWFAGMGGLGDSS